MSQRPCLDKNLNSKTLYEFYYLKEELVDFCRKNSIPTTGGKIEITSRIAHFLDTGEILSSKTKSKTSKFINIIIENSVIETDFVCSETHREFFKQQIGPKFSFNVIFQKWLKQNSGKTYSQAVQAYHEIMEQKKNNKTTIDKQFEYNTYIRDFFEHNNGKTLEQAIICWKYKKSLQGHNKYELSDLDALEN